MQKLTITYRLVSDLTANVRNARTHDRRQLRQIKNSIEAFGFTNPLLVDEAGVLIAGHGRLLAAIDLQLSEVPVVVLTHLTDIQKRALMLADNKIAMNAGWNMDMLAEELVDISTLDLGIDLGATGFEMAEIDLILESAHDPAGSEQPVETAPEPNPNAAIFCRRGDLWRLGNHRVLCGDAKNPSDIAILMDDDRADAVFTDPPYNVPIRGHVSGNGRVQHREFAEASGEMDVETFQAFLAESLGLAAEYSRPGAVAFICMDWRHMGEMIRAGTEALGPLLNLCVWAKTNGGMGSLYRSQHELVFVFRNGGTSHRNNVQLGRYGRNRTNVWSYAGVNTFREGRMDDLRAHPTAKPVAMVKDALLDVTKRGDLVLDPFLGAGTTLIAAELSGRIARGLEIDPAYVDVILRRWRRETGEDPVRAADGEPLRTIEARMRGEVAQ